MSQPNRVRWVGVQPTTPASNPIPVCNVCGTTVYVGGPSPLPTEDTGKNTNRRQYEQDHSFRSQVLQLTDGDAHALYTLTTTPARTAGLGVYIYVITVFSKFGNTIGEVGLEQPAGTQIYPRIAVNGEETALLTLETPIPVGITGVFARAYRGTTVIGVDVQILGLEC